MLKKLIMSISFVICFQLLLTWFAYATGDLKEEQQRLQNERSSVNTKLTDAKEEIKILINEKEELNDQISDLNDTINEFEGMIMNTKEMMEENEDRIDNIEKEINILQDDLDKRTDLLKDRAMTYQKTGSHNISYLDVILGSKSFSDFISRIVSLSKISQADENFLKQTMENQTELFDLQEEVEEAIRGLEEQLEELDIIYETVQTEKNEIESLIEDKKKLEKKQQQFIDQLINEEKELGKKENEVRKQIEDEIRLQEEAKRKAAEEKRRQASNSTQNTNVSRGNTSQASNDGRWQTFIATAYTANCKGCSGITYTGINLKANPNSKVIAVDPKVIPLGSRVEVKGYGIFLAADTGGAIQGRKIDIFMNNKGNAHSFGVRSIQIRILN